MKFLTLGFYIVFLAVLISNIFGFIVFFDSYDQVIFALWLINLFFIIYWNIFLWKRKDLSQGAKIGFLAGSIIFPYIVLPFVAFKYFGKQ